MSAPETETNVDTSPSTETNSTEESQPAATEETSATIDVASDLSDVKEEETSLSKIEQEETIDNGDGIDEEDTSASISFSFEENSNVSKVPTESENSVASQEIDSNGIVQNDEPKSTTDNMECDLADKEIDLKTEIDAIVEEEKESSENDSVASKENTDKSNVIDDDLIFVKPKEKDRGHCYCAKDRNLNIVELLCANCNRWFHESCISYQLGKLVPFMTNYVFLCKNCSPSGLEIFKKNQSTISQLCITALANLIQTSRKEGKTEKLFSKDKDIIPFIECHWEAMTTTARRVTQSWHSTVLRTLTKDAGTYFVLDTKGPETTFTLTIDITQVKPNYEAMLKGGHLKMTEMGVQPVGGAGIKGRGGAKRKAPGEGSNLGVGKRNRIETAPVKLSPHGYPLEHPFNKDGFRYFLAEPDPHAPFRQEFDESSELAGKPIPGWLYRSLCPNSVLIALHDRAPQLRVSEDRLSVVGEKGYCMARATHYVSRGMWYFEVNVDEMRDGSACRIGWGQAFANLQTSLGFDKFGYCWRSRKGTVFHEAKGKHYSDGFGEGDTLGLLIHLPDKRDVVGVPPTLKDRPLVKFKSHLYYEEKDYLAEKTKSLTPLPGSRIAFFKNGKCQGDAFVDIYEGQYYPTVSLYKSCILSLNFGPDFKHPPAKEEFPFRAMWERAEETICEQTLSDLIYLTENDGKLKLDL